MMRFYGDVTDTKLTFPFGKVWMRIEVCSENWMFIGFLFNVRTLFNKPFYHIVPLLS
jgi:hypothetical protein